MRDKVPSNILALSTIWVSTKDVKIDFNTQFKMSVYILCGLVLDETDICAG